MREHCSCKSDDRKRPSTNDYKKKTHPSEVFEYRSAAWPCGVSVQGKKRMQVETEHLKPGNFFVFEMCAQRYFRRKILSGRWPGLRPWDLQDFSPFPTRYSFGHDDGEAQCPVLLKTGPTIIEHLPRSATQWAAMKIDSVHRQVEQYESFKSEAVTCFSICKSYGVFPTCQAEFRSPLAGLGPFPIPTR